MKKIIFIILSVVLGAAMMGCSEDENVIYLESPAVGLQQVGPAGIDGFTFRISPDGKTAGYFYAVTTDEMDARFRSLSSGAIVQREPSEGPSPEGWIAMAEQPDAANAEIALDHLEPNTNYVVYARGYDSSGGLGPVALLRVTTAIHVEEKPIEVQTSYITSTSVAVVVDPVNRFYKFESALGTASDRESFIAGTMSGISRYEQLLPHTQSFFDLAPDTDYVFYIRGWDRMDRESEVVEIPLATLRSGEGPEVTMHVDEIDLFKGTYRFEPNSKCGKMTVLVCRKGANDEVFFNPYQSNGDIASALLKYASNPYDMNTITEEDSPVDFELLTPELITEDPIEAYVLLYDTDKQPVAVQRFETKTPAFDPSAGRAEITDIEFTGVYPWYFYYRYTCNEHTMLALSMVFAAEYFEELLADYGEQYLHDYVFDNGAAYSYKTPVVEGVANSIPPGRYYFVVSPMNANGREGFGPLAYEEIIVPES